MIGSVRSRYSAFALLWVCGLVSLTTSCASEVDVEKLYVQANSEDYEERVEARDKLEDLVQKKDVEPFARGLRSANAEARVQSILHLQAIESPEAKEALIGELDLTRRFNVFYNPIRLVPVSTPSDSRIMIAHIVLLKGGDPKAVKILSDSYGREPDAPARVATLYAIGALKDPAGIPTLFRGLKDPDMDAVRASVEGLQLMHSDKITESLIEGLSDTHEQIRLNSVVALTGFHESESFQALLKAAEKDSSRKVRAAAIFALFGTGGAIAFDPVLGLLKENQADAEIRDAAIRALRSFTGQDFGADVPKWNRWWQQNHSQFGGS